VNPLSTLTILIPFIMVRTSGVSTRWSGR